MVESAMAISIAREGTAVRGDGVEMSGIRYRGCLVEIAHWSLIREPKLCVSSL